jgi:dienelactone hydrolase
MEADELRLAGYPEPLGLWRRRTAPPEGYPELRTERIEYSSRGDRVRGRLLLPPGGGHAHPLVLLQHGAGGSAESPYLETTGGPWARRGLAVASIDFPLHGARADQKLAERLAPLMDATRSGEAPDALLVEFARQAVIDLERALDALAAFDEVDEERMAFAGFSLGAMLGAAFCALDPRPRAAVFALGGGGLGCRALDPASYVGRIAPRPVLFINASSDASVPRAAAEAFFAGAREPKQQIWFDASHEALPGVALKAMWQFLADHLQIDEPRA